MDNLETSIVITIVVFVSIAMLSLGIIGYLLYLLLRHLL